MCLKQLGAPAFITDAALRKQCAPCRYGYSFGSAAADVWHKVNFEAMLYPGYSTYGRHSVVT